MKYIFILFASLFFCNFLVAQQVGSKVSFTAVDGKTYTGTINQIQADKYKIKYDGFDFESWLKANQFTVTDNNNQPAGNQPSLPQSGTETLPMLIPQTTGETTPQTTQETIPQTVTGNTSQQVSQATGTDNTGRKPTSSDSLKMALNNMKSAVGAFTKLFASKRDTMSIMINDIDYDNPNLSLLKENLKNVRGVKSVTMRYKSPTATMEISYKGKAMDVWDNLSAAAKSSFKLMEASDNNIILKQRTSQ